MRSDDQCLYFIAIIPHSELREEVRAVKVRMRDRHGAGHALKSPAHITLQMPFKRNIRDELPVSAALRTFAAKETPFNVDLDGFGCFAPRVIYIRVTDPEPVRELHMRLKQMLIDILGFSQNEIMQDVQPHITVATRDLTRDAFREAWAEMKDEEFRGTFGVNSIFLLKHNGRDWNILKEFPFRENG